MVICNNIWKEKKWFLSLNCNDIFPLKINKINVLINKSTINYIYIYNKDKRKNMYIWRNILGKTTLIGLPSITEVVFIRPAIVYTVEVDKGIARSIVKRIRTVSNPASFEQITPILFFKRSVVYFNSKLDGSGLFSLRT